MKVLRGKLSIDVMTAAGEALLEVDDGLFGQWDWSIEPRYPGGVDVGGTAATFDAALAAAVKSANSGSLAGTRGRKKKCRCR